MIDPAHLIPDLLRNEKTSSHRTWRRTSASKPHPAALSLGPIALAGGMLFPMDFLNHNLNLFPRPATR
jgi:hypothetical protein